MFLLVDGECVSEVWGPIENGDLKTCSECGQVAFRVLHVNSFDTSREVALCGSHFNDACVRYPDVKRFSQLRLAGPSMDISYDLHHF